MQTWTKPEVITVESIDYIKYISAAADSKVLLVAAMTAIGR